jgi:uncharacterized membrane protein YfcA
VPDPKTTLLVLLAGIAIIFSLFWGYSLRKQPKDSIWPNPLQCLIGFVTDFLDTLGVGSFAVTTALFRFGKVVDDDKIPGTLNVGHTLPTILQALIYIQVVEIDPTTLWLLIIASGLGSYFGVAFVTSLPKHKIQIAMGISLLVAVAFILGRLLGFYPQGNDAIGLTGGFLALGFIGNFVFGALMTIGVGAYAPIMVMVGLLGMTETTAFPLMMGSCAFLMPVASYRFIQTGKYDVRSALGLTLLGLPAVAIAAWIVKSLPLDAVKWLVVVVVMYTACSMLNSGLKSKREG